MRLLLYFLCAVIAAIHPACAQTAAKSSPPGKSAAHFVRQAPLVKWAQPLLTVSATKSEESVVLRLVDTQVMVGANPATLFNFAIQVNSQNALGEIGQFGISYFPAYQKLLLHRVAILRGSEVIDHTATVNTRLLERESNIEAGMYGGATTVQLLLSDVRVGDALWLTYTIEGQNPVFAGRWAGEFNWDSGSPVEMRRLVVTHPRERPLNWRQVGDFEKEKILPLVEQIGQFERLTFSGKNILPVEYESSVPADYLPRRILQFSEYGSWQEVAKWADSLFPAVASTPALKTLVRQFAPQGSQSDKVEAALKWVQNEVRYFSVSMGENSHRPQPPDVVIRRRYGDCKDKTYLLMSILAELGIKSEPILVDAEAPKLPVKLMPSATWFNHVILHVQVDGRSYYVDPTRSGEKGELSSLPTAFPGAAGLFVNPSTRELVILPEEQNRVPRLERIEKFIIAAFDADATLEVRKIYRGRYAAAARLSLPGLSASELKKGALAEYEKQFPGVTLAETPQLKDSADGRTYEVLANFILRKPVKHKDNWYHIELESRLIDDTMGIPGKLVRNFPFAFPLGRYWGRSQVEIYWPKTVRIDQAPKAEVVDNEFFTLREEHTLRGNHFSYSSDYQIKQAEIQATALPDLQLKAKELLEFIKADYRVNEEAVSKPEGLTFSFRDVDGVTSVQLASAIWKKTDGKGDKKTPDIIKNCDAALRLRAYADLFDMREEAEADLERLIAKQIDQADAKLCLARLKFLRGRFAESVPLFEAQARLPDADRLTAKLAWARYFAGDLGAALIDIERYFYAKKKTGTLSRSDLADVIALHQRIGKPLPRDVVQETAVWQDAVWPAPILAMLLGRISPNELIGEASAFVGDDRELALNEAWFYVAQKHLAEGRSQDGAKALRWYSMHGIRSSTTYEHAIAELWHRDMSDADLQAGLLAFRAKDFKLAKQKYESAAARKVPEAFIQLGMMSYYGNGDKADYADALQWFRQGALLEHPGSMNFVGVLYAEGRGVPKDEAIALDWYKRAAALGHSYAAFNLGDRYLRGRSGLEQDFKLACQYLGEAAELGHGRAQAALSYLYQEGKGCVQSDIQAVFWAGRSSEQGNSGGDIQFGYFLREGIQVKKDVEHAAGLFYRAAKGGDEGGQFQLANAYSKGEGVPRNDFEAAFWMQKSAFQGNFHAQARLGAFLLDGRGVLADAEKARFWLEKAAAAGSVPALSSLGDYYRRGILGKPDMVRALDYYQQAAAQDYDVAQLELGLIYHFGLGVGKDLPTAAKWYRLAAEQGSPLAKNNLANMFEKGEGVEQNLALAVRLYREAAETGLEVAFYSLATLYEAGKGVPQDMTAAYVYYQLAFKLGYKKLEARGPVLARQLKDGEQARGDKLVEAWKVGVALPDVKAPTAS